METTTARRYPRVPIDAGLTEDDGATSCALRLRDISETGLYAESDQGDCLDTAVSLSVEFYLPGDPEPVWALCDVVRDDRVGFCDGHALRFQRISARDQARIASYVRRYHQPVAVPRVRAQARAVGQAKQVVMFRAVSELLC